MNGNQEPPVKVGEIYEVSINAVGEKGDGIARVKGFVLFVPQVQKGDYVKIRITKVLPKVGFAEVTAKLDAPPPRESKFATMNPEELHKEEESSQQYEETENFGEESEK